MFRFELLNLLLMKLLFIYFALLYSFLRFPVGVFASTIFFDDFNSGNYDKWTIARNSGNGQWYVENGVFKARYSQPGVSEMVPKDIYWQSTWNDYSLETDMTFVSGVDKNLAFRYSDSSNWYDVHFSGGIVSLQKVLNGNQLPPFPIEVFRNFINGFTYHVKIVALNNNIKFYVNNELIIEYTDNNTPLLSGKPALQASAGGIPGSEVWFDNVRVSSFEENVPVVIVPGFGGSWNYKKFFRIDENSIEWELTPTIKVYDNLINTLKQSGYVINEDLFVFLYDWRRPLEETAGVLHDYLTDNFGSQKVNLVGHSLGGMLLNTYVQHNPNPLANKVITLGSPHQGAVEAYPAVAGGDLKRNHLDEWLVTEILLKFHQEPFETKKKTIERVVPSASELLPIFNYLRKNGVLIDYSIMHLQNPLLGFLRSTQEAIPDKTSFSTYAGDGLSTLEFLDVVEPSWAEKVLGLWEDGKVIGRANNLVGGDSYVLKNSGLINVIGIKNKEFSNYDHTLIVSGEQSIQKVLDELGIVGSPVISNVPQTNYLVFMLASPASFRITDPLSRSMENIPDAYISYDEKFVMVPNPLSGTYKTEVVGEGLGEYKLSFGRMTETDFDWSDFQATTSANQVDTYNFSADQNVIINEPLTDNEGEDYLKLIIARLNKIKSENSALSGKVDAFLTFLNTKTKGCKLLSGIQEKLIDLRLNNEINLTLEKDTFDISGYILGMSYICNQKGQTNDHRFKKLEEKITLTDDKLKTLSLVENEKLVAIIYQRALDEFERAKTEKSLKHLLKGSMLLDYSSAFLDEALWYGGVR